MCESGCGGGSTDMMELTLSIKILCLHDERLNTYLIDLNKINSRSAHLIFNLAIFSDNPVVETQRRYENGCKQQAECYRYHSFCIIT